MKKILGSFLRQLAFWILFFDFSRVIHLLYHLRIAVAQRISFSEVLSVFVYSFRLDLATACYFMTIPFLILAVQTLWTPRGLNTFNKIYTGFMVICYSLMTTGELGIYSEWETKLSYKALKYLSHPSEVYNSAPTWTFFLLIVLLVFMSAAGILAYRKWFFVPLFNERKNYWFSPLFILLMPLLIFLGMRGGWQAIPINQSQSYFSHHRLANDVCVNNAFNLYISVFENLDNYNRNPFVFMDQANAEKIVNDLFAIPKDTTVRILTTTRPNVVLLILESWSADLIEDLSGKPGITPQFHKLEEGGILFRGMYSSGARSEQGMAAIFGGFPSHPISCTTVQPDKYKSLPSLPMLIKGQGYSTAFYFGGQLIYGNIKGYIYYNGFDKIMEIEDFPSNLPRGKLGIHDEYTLAYLASDLNHLKQPFFSALFTLSSHSPYDQPFEKPLNWGGSEHDYINSGYYTDYSLGKFFEKARKQPWYPNTLFILVADHSHRSYYNRDLNTREYHRVPMLFYGDVIRPEFRGVKWEKLCNQNDIPATLLAQMDLPHGRFKWSRDLFNPYSPDFAYFTNDYGAGWIKPGVNISFDVGKEFNYAFYIDPSVKDSVFNECKAYLQVVFNEYLKQ